jgi:hypothetical protein
VTAVPRPDPGLFFPSAANAPWGGNVPQLFPLGAYGGDVLGTAAYTINNLRVAPFWVPRSCRISALSLNVTVVAALGVARLGIYNSDPTTGYPSSLLLDAGECSTAALGLTQVIGLAQWLAAGTLYWAASIWGVAQPTTTTINGAANYAGPVGVSPAAPTVTPNRLFAARAYGPLPDPCIPMTNSSTGGRPCVFATFSA